ncbi:hypothetical protein [Helicobacter sp. 23-1045]
MGEFGNFGEIFEVLEIFLEVFGFFCMGNAESWIFFDFFVRDSAFFCNEKNKRIRFFWIFYVRFCEFCRI